MVILGKVNDIATKTGHFKIAGKIECFREKGKKDGKQNVFVKIYLKWPENLFANFRSDRFITDEKIMLPLNGQEKSCQVCSWVDGWM